MEIFKHEENLTKNVCYNLISEQNQQYHSTEKYEGTCKLTIRYKNKKIQRGF